MTKAVNFGQISLMYSTPSRRDVPLLKEWCWSIRIYLLCRYSYGRIPQRRMVQLLSLNSFPRFRIAYASILQGAQLLRLWANSCGCMTEFRKLKLKVVDVNFASATLKQWAKCCSTSGLRAMEDCGLMACNSQPLRIDKSWDKLSCHRSSGGELFSSSKAKCP